MSPFTSTFGLIERFREGDETAFSQSVSGGTPLDYQVANGSPLLVTAQTDALRRYISAHAEDVFSDFEHLKRKRETSIQP